MTKTSTAVKVLQITPAQRVALNKLADKLENGTALAVPMRRSTNSALHDMGLMFQGQITAAGLEAVGR